jgi:hypothetical protein
MGNKVSFDYVRRDIKFHNTKKKRLDIFVHGLMLIGVWNSTLWCLEVYVKSSEKKNR